MTKLTNSTFKEAISNGNCLVAIGAPWCPDCRKIQPLMEILEKENENVKFFSVQMDEEEELKNSLNIRRIPTLIFYKNGVEVGERLIEPSSKNTIENALKTAMNA